MTVGFVALAVGASVAVAFACAAHAPAATHAGASGARAGVVAPLARAACTRFAAPRGRDSYRGTKRRPFKTAQRLADALRPGETGCLRRGVYTDPSDDYVLTFERGGSRGAPIRLRSYPGERATLAGVVYVPEGSNHVTLSRLTFVGVADVISPIKIYATDVAVASSTITNKGRGKSCMILGSTSGYGRAARAIVRGNRFHDCGRREDDNQGHGIYVQNVVGARITRNVFWRIQAYAVVFYPNASRTWFAGNIVDGGSPSVRGGVLFGGNDDFASSGNVVERNVIAYARTANITSGWDDLVGRGNVARGNCVWGAGDRNIDVSDGGFTARGNIVARPRFVNRSRRDYRLRLGSRCRRVVAPRTGALTDSVVAPG